MNNIELFETWAPPESIWSRWAKPILFAELSALDAIESPGAPTLRVTLEPDRATAVVVDLPGEESVMAGLDLAVNGFRPVPLFNAARGPSTVLQPTAMINLAALCHWLVIGAEQLRSTRLPFDAPPAFLLDSRRQNPTLLPMPGRFDNRWLVFPQDFPSANFLREHSIKCVVLVRYGAEPPPEDSTHVLLRWQMAGIEVRSWDPKTQVAPQAIKLKRPPFFKSLLQRCVALAGLRRNSAGGFGSIIPQPSSG